MSWWRRLHRRWMWHRLSYEGQRVVAFCSGPNSWEWERYREQYGHVSPGNRLVNARFPDEG